jgi:hypothetical protein
MSIDFFMQQEPQMDINMQLKLQSSVALHTGTTLLRKQKKRSWFVSMRFLTEILVLTLEISSAEQNLRSTPTNTVTTIIFTERPMSDVALSNV